MSDRLLRNQAFSHPEVRTNTCPVFSRSEICCAASRRLTSTCSGRSAALMSRETYATMVDEDGYLVSRHNHADHDHRHVSKNFGFAFAVGTLLNIGLVAAQFLYGIHAHSIALISDAAHNLGDALGLLIAWGAYILARWEPTDRYTSAFVRRPSSLRS